MKIEKIKIEKEVLDNNFLFYLFLKELNSANRLNSEEINEILNIYYFNKKNAYGNVLEQIEKYILTIKENVKRGCFLNILSRIDKEFKLVLFIFSLELIKIKPLLLSESDIYCSNIIIKNSNVNKLSLEFDNLNKDYPYYKRISCALLSLIFFQKIESNELNFMSEDSAVYLKYLADEFNYLKKYNIEANQIFMLMFTESVNQSIKSSAGGSYEDRIENVLISIGLEKKDIKKIHDNQDKSTEYDFFFSYKNRTYGIGAKRTLRERYKQFIKTSYSSKIDVMIEITLGLDLTEEKLKTIKQHDIYLFVADEIFENQKFLHNDSCVYPASKLSLKTLENLK
ncbi:MAG TPA: hypothetical protein VLL98_05810 [Rickettsiales bacterium]|nr:hypothetical protein [Rickettsiales bacterium]